MFCSQTGGPLDERNITRTWDRVRRKAQAEGVPPLRLHDARHTFASPALAAGKSVRWVASQLGHANPAMILALIYVSRVATGILVLLAGFAILAFVLEFTLQHWLGREVQPRVDS